MTFWPRILWFLTAVYLQQQKKNIIWLLLVRNFTALVSEFIYLKFDSFYYSITVIKHKTDKNN